MKTLSVLAMTAAATALLGAAPTPSKWESPVPAPSGARKFTPETRTQSIYRLNSRDTIDLNPIKALKPKWHQSGGMQGVAGFSSHKYVTLPEAPKSWVGTIQVWNGHNYQPNKGLRVAYPEGTRFDDILTNAEGTTFEHRVREKVNGTWRSRVVYSDKEARPAGYTGLKQTCASCHDEAGSGGYAVGLTPGGDTVLSYPMDWNKVSAYRRPPGIPQPRVAATGREPPPKHPQAQPEEAQPQPHPVAARPAAAQPARTQPRWQPRHTGTRAARRR